jgi:hypothetical protein
MLDWYKIAIVVCLVVLGAVMWSRSRVKINVEPLENQDKNAKDALDKITKITTEIQDGLNISTYNDTYQDTVLEFDKWAGLRLVEMLKNPENLVKNVAQFNDVCDFKKNLNVVMGVLDKA